MAIRTAGALLGALVLTAAPLSAQVLGIPVVNNGAGSGLAVGADLGMTNAAGGDFTSYGAHASLGVGLIGVKGMVSHTSIDGDGVLAKGVSATFRLFGGPLIPFRAMVQAGWGQWSPGDDVTVTRVPVSLGVAATIPNPAFAIKPWIAPRVEFARTSIAGDADTDSYFAVSGGIDITLLNGITLRAAYDRTMKGDPKPGVLGFGVSFSP